MELTPLCGPKIAPILKAGIGSIPVPIETAARLMPRPLGRFRQPPEPAAPVSHSYGIIITVDG